MDDVAKACLDMDIEMEDNIDIKAITQQYDNNNVSRDISRKPSVIAIKRSNMSLPSSRNLDQKILSSF
jgi:hypothetical protein